MTGIVRIDSHVLFMFHLKRPSVKSWLNGGVRDRDSTRVVRCWRSQTLSAGLGKQPFLLLSPVCRNRAGGGQRRGINAGALLARENRVHDGRRQERQSQHARVT